MHLVPAGPNVAAALDGIGAGRVLRLEGHLVTIAGPGGFTWTSSTSRLDTGGGACELVLVRSVEVLR
jgi:hypothetical protein